jgi:putative tryptophan/tyrosine transport system substrate-binding protein
MNANMKRREFITLLGGAVAAWPLAVNAQQPVKLWRIGMLETISWVQNAPQLDAFRQRLQQLGYVEGINFVIEYRSAEGRGDRFPSLVAELIQRNVDLLVLRGTPAAIAVKNATSTIPVVMTAVGDPLLVVASLSRPGGNLTGLSSFVVDLEAKRLELLKEIYPQAARVAALRNMGNPAVQNNWKEVELAAQSLGVRAQLFDVRKSEDISLAFENAIKNQCNALLADQDALTQANKELIVSLAAKHRLPAIYPARDYAAAGGLMSFGVDYPDLYRRAAIYVDKIIKGAKPADLPVEQPTKFELVINQKTAKALGIPVPAIMLARADEVIE